MNLEGRRVLITGGAGLVGSHIADHLARENVAEIVVLDNFSRGRRENLQALSQSPILTLVEGDIGDRPLLGEIMQGIDLVFHQAAIRITQCAEQPRLALEALCTGTFNVLEACVEAGVQRVVAASSASIYGMAESFPTGETHHPYHNRTFYGAAKAFNEGMLRSFHEMYGLDYLALRYFNVYGPRMDIAGLYTEVLIRWMERIASGQAPLIHGDGAQTMDFVYIEDVARANILAAMSEASDQALNVGSGRETSLLELARALLGVMGSDLAVQHGEQRAVNAVRRRLADTRLAREVLGFSAQVNLEEGLRRLVAWWRGQRDAQPSGGS
jgi:UDP-glucose 4-epimerase